MCDSCIYNIGSEAETGCFTCRVPTRAGVCKTCAPRLPFSHAYIAGERLGELRMLLDDFKFNRAYQIHASLAKLLDQRLPQLAKDTVVTPLPTIARHIRVRGYDHTDLMAKAFAKRRGLNKKKLLVRQTNNVQLGASAAVRKKQASVAFTCDQALDPDVAYLLVDDIVTTGATLIAAARCLKKAGARQIIVAAVARQVL